MWLLSKYVRRKDMPNKNISVTRLPAVPMTVGSLMKRPMVEVQNYASEVIPLLRLRRDYKNSFMAMLKMVPGNLYAVANFNLRSAEPEWCRQRLNYFDMKIARCLLGKNWSRKPESERPSWIAVPEQATYLHYNMIWDVPIDGQERFFLEAPEIWRKIVPSGQFHVQVIGEEAGEADATRIYSGKTFHPRWTIDNAITSTELRRKK
jgi:hypothetical protein